jgi:hypothetical protein
LPIATNRDYKARLEGLTFSRAIFAQWVAYAFLHALINLTFCMFALNTIVGDKEVPASLLEISVLFYANFLVITHIRYFLTVRRVTLLAWVLSLLVILGFHGFILIVSNIGKTGVWSETVDLWHSTFASYRSVSVMLLVPVAACLVDYVGYWANKFSENT